MSKLKPVDGSTDGIIFLNGRKLIPLGQHKGPILKLTKREKSEIAILEKELAEKIASACKFRSYIQNSNLSIDMKRNYYSKLWDIEMDIDILKNKIREIKVNRYNHQKNK